MPADQVVGDTGKDSPHTPDMGVRQEVAAAALGDRVEAEAAEAAEAVEEADEVANADLYSDNDEESVSCGRSAVFFK